MIAHAAWFAEFVFEALGLFFFSRRKITALWIWSAFRVTTDLVNFLIQLIYSQQAYNWAEYFQRNAQYVVLAAVCVACVGQILRERPKTRKAHQAGLCVLLAIGIVLLHAKWPPSADMVLLFEAGAEFFLASSIVLALAMVNARAPRPWGLIAAALIILTVSDAIVTMLARQDWAYWASWYPVGAIVGLGMLAWAGWKDWCCEEARLSLPKKIPPSSVMIQREMPRRVM